MRRMGRSSRILGSLASHLGFVSLPSLLPSLPPFALLSFAPTCDEEQFWGGASPSGLAPVSRQSIVAS